jgi:hypothetical protein
MDLMQRSKGGPYKLKIARRRRQEATMTLTRIVRRLNMGPAGSLANLLPDAEKNENM